MSDLANRHRPVGCELPVGPLDKPGHLGQSLPSMSEVPAPGESDRLVPVYSRLDDEAGKASVSSRPKEEALPSLRWWHFLVFAVIYLYAFPYFDRLRNANEMPRILMTKAIVDRGVLNRSEERRVGKECRYR